MDPYQRISAIEPILQSRGFEAIEVGHSSKALVPVVDGAPALGFEAKGAPMSTSLGWVAHCGVACYDCLLLPSVG